MDTAIDEIEPPHQIVEHGRGGRANRIPDNTVWELLEGPGGLTRVSVSHWTEPSNPVDRVLEVASGTARWQERSLAGGAAPPPRPARVGRGAPGSRRPRGWQPPRDRHPLSPPPSIDFRPPMSSLRRLVPPLLAALALVALAAGFPPAAT